MARNIGQKPTSERIRELFDYDAETGVITKKVVSRVYSGERRYGVVGAGSISTHGYVMVSIDGRNYNAGCIAWAFVHGEWPNGTIRYRNGNKTDNRLDNLLLVSEGAGQIKHRPLTQGRLKEILHYEPGTGWFTWRVASPLANVGERAGGYHGHGYRTIGIDYNKYLEHSLAFLYITGEWPPSEVDHINNDRGDNRWENLRPVTRTDNNHNRGRVRTGRVGYTGVHVCGTRYRAMVNHEKKEIHIGVYATVAEARIARLLGELEHIGWITSYVEERDSRLPIGEDRFVRVVKNHDTSFIAYDHNDVPYHIKGVETITGIIAAWPTSTEGKE